MKSSRIILLMSQCFNTFKAEALTYFTSPIQKEKTKSIVLSQYQPFLVIQYYLALLRQITSTNEHKEYNYAGCYVEKFA